jgi:hypothetical protein
METGVAYVAARSWDETNARKAIVGAQQLGLVAVGGPAFVLGLVLVPTDLSGRKWLGSCKNRTTKTAPQLRTRQRAQNLRNYSADRPIELT